MSNPNQNTPTRPVVDRVDVMVRDADFALVMWEITAGSVDHSRALIEREWPRAHLVLRVRSQTSERHPTVRTLDIPIDRWVGNRYVPLGSPGAVHTFTLGLKGPRRESFGDVFVAIARSAPVQPPRARPARPEVEPQWADAPTRERRA